MDSTTKLRVAITGATGLIGGHLVDRFLERGYDVAALVRNVEKDRSRLPSDVELHEWRASSTEGSWRDAVAGADVVVTLAGAPIAVRWTDERKRAIVDSRVDGTRNVVDAMNEGTGSDRLLLAGSAVGYYGGYAFDPVDETDGPGDDFLAETCVAWEGATEGTGEGIRVVRLRTGVVLDTEGGALKELLTPFRLGVGGPIAGGRQPMPWIHIEDEIGLILHLIDHPEVSGPVNLVAPEPATNREFSKTLGRVIGRPAIMPIPALAIRAMLGEAAVTVLGGQNARPMRAERFGYLWRFPELQGALENLLA